MIEGSAQASRATLIENFGIPASFWHKLPSKEKAEKLTVMLICKELLKQPV